MGNSALVSPESGGWRFTLSDPELTYIAVNFQTRLQFGPTEVVIETPFDLVSDGQVVRMDPGDRSGLGPILTLYPDELAEAVADRNRVLRLTFVSGKQLVIPPHPEYESWSFVGPGTNLVVCTPGVGGGDLAIWT